MSPVVEPQEHFAAQTEKKYLKLNFQEGINVPSLKNDEKRNFPEFFLLIFSFLPCLCGGRGIAQWSACLLSELDCDLNLGRGNNAVNCGIF